MCCLKHICHVVANTGYSKTLFCPALNSTKNEDSQFLPLPQPLRFTSKTFKTGSVPLEGRYTGAHQEHPAVPDVRKAKERVSDVHP